MHASDDPLQPIPRKVVGCSQSLPDDEWPALARLLSSAEGGCAFCGFLREAVLSAEFTDALEHSTGSTLVHNDSKTITFSLTYGELSRMEYDHLDQFVVMVEFEDSTVVVLRFHIEAILGKKPGLTARTVYVSGIAEFVLLPQSTQLLRIGSASDLRLHQTMRIAQSPRF